MYVSLYCIRHTELKSSELMSCFRHPFYFGWRRNHVSSTSFIAVILLMLHTSGLTGVEPLCMYLWHYVVQHWRQRWRRYKNNSLLFGPHHAFFRDRNPSSLRPDIKRHQISCVFSVAQRQNRMLVLLACEPPKANFNIEGASLEKDGFNQHDDVDIFRRDFHERIDCDSIQPTKSTSLEKSS